jgi:hypothetical protein
MGCMVPQPFAAGGNRSYPEFLGHNRRPAVPGVFYLDKESFAEKSHVARDSGEQGRSSNLDWSPLQVHNIIIDILCCMDLS